jgi:hypothetical protein
MQLELMWQCGSHHGSELFRDDLLAHSAVAFFKHVADLSIDHLTPAACTVLRRTAGSCTEAEILVRRYALAWLAFSEPEAGKGPAISVTIRRSNHVVH